MKTGTKRHGVTTACTGCHGCKPVHLVVDSTPPKMFSDPVFLEQYAKLLDELLEQRQRSAWGRGG